MKRRHDKEFSLKYFFPKDLKSTRTEFENKDSKDDDKWNYNSKSHVEKINESRENSSKSKGSTISHKNLCWVDVEEEKSSKYRN